MTGDGLDGLRAAVGAEHVLTAADQRASYETDWTGRWHGDAGCVVRPADTGQVATVLTACAAAGLHVTVQGGNTGLVGGATPSDGEVVLSLTRLRELGPVDVGAGQVTVGAGVPLAVVQQHARAAGLDFGVDLAARDSATVGGLAATNAGGIRVLRHGSMRAQVMGAEAVLADGSTISRLQGLPKDNTGYDLVQLLCGSEGTLAVITRLRLRLVPRDPESVVALLALDDVAAAVAVVPWLRATLPGLAAAELMLPAGLRLVSDHAGLPAPFGDPHGAYLLVECAGRAGIADATLDEIAEAPGVSDAAVGTDPSTRRALWHYREGHTEAINARGVPVKLDVAVPLDSLASFVDDATEAVAAVAPDAGLIAFGHVNEGNLHLNVLGAGDRAEAVTDEVLRLVAARGGSISSEHGIGRAKARHLGLSRSPAEIAAMRAVKRALDPDGLLNPGVLLAAEPVASTGNTAVTGGA